MTWTTIKHDLLDFLNSRDRQREPREQHTIPLSRQGAQLILNQVARLEDDLERTDAALTRALALRNK